MTTWRTMGFWVMLLFFQATAAQVVWESHLDTNRILIGEQTLYTLQASGLESIENLKWPVWPDTLQGIEVLQTTSDTVRENNLWRIKQQILITSFDSGFVIIPPLTLQVGGQARECEPQLLNVSTVALDPQQDYYDIKKPIEAPIDWWYWLTRIWVILAIIALVFGLILWLWLRKRKAKAVAKVVDLRTPAQRAKDNLQAIKAEKLWEKQPIKSYYSRTTDVVRTYIEEEMGIAAMEMISDELLEKIALKIDASTFELIKKMLQTADMVKFAKMQPATEMHEAHWQRCMRFVEQTETKQQPNDA